MNFDKFKSIKPKRMSPPKNDNGYSQKLLDLKPRQKNEKIIPILSTCAAAAVIITVVGVWALIGRGIQIGDVTDTPATSDTPQQSTQSLIKDESITTLQREAFFDMFAKYKINGMPEFSEGNMPSESDMARYIYHLNPDEVADDEMPAEIFNRDTKALFGFDYGVEDYVKFTRATAEYPFAELIEYKVEGNVVTATAAVYYVWNLTDKDCAELYPVDYAIEKTTVTSGDGNIIDITAIYTVKYLSDDGINPTKFLSMEKCSPPSDEYYEYFK